MPDVWLLSVLTLHGRNLSICYNWVSFVHPPAVGHRHCTWYLRSLVETGALVVIIELSTMPQLRIVIQFLIFRILLLHCMELLSSQSLTWLERITRFQLNLLTFQKQPSSHHLAFLNFFVCLSGCETQHKHFSGLSMRCCVAYILAMLTLMMSSLLVQLQRNIDAIYAWFWNAFRSMALLSILPSASLVSRN